MLAMAAGFCVERGADPAACAEPILDGVHRDLLDALEFARRWTATGAAEDELPEPDEKIIDDALLARLGGDVYEATRLALAWCSVEEWQPPALAVLCRSAEVRLRHASALLPACRDLAALERHDLKCLAYALAVLDDEPLAVLHRPTGTGFEVHIGGIGDNFQLHTLLAHVLVGGGHVPGTTPSAESVRLATDPEPAQGRTQTVATGVFELLAADGERIWNEGSRCGSHGRRRDRRTHDLTAARAHGIVQACLSRQILITKEPAPPSAPPTTATANYPSTTGSTTATMPVCAQPANASSSSSSPGACSEGHAVQPIASAASSVQFTPS